MLDTNICSFLIRQKPDYLLTKLQNTVRDRNIICISSITYSELMFGATSKKASTKMPAIVEEFVSRIDEVLAWDKLAVEQATIIKCDLESRGTPISHNDTLIAGHAIASNSVLVTDNVREFSRVTSLAFENWVER